MNYPFNVESCHGIPYSWINEISWNLDLEPFGWPRTGKLKEFYKTELKRTNNEHPYQNIYKISGTILIYFDLHHSTFWFWPSLAFTETFPCAELKRHHKVLGSWKSRSKRLDMPFLTRIHDWSFENHGICAWCFCRDSVRFAASCFFISHFHSFSSFDRVV